MATAEKLRPYEIVLTGDDAEQRLMVMASSSQKALDEFMMALGFANFHRKRPGRCRIEVESLFKPIRCR